MILDLLQIIGGMTCFAMVDVAAYNMARKLRGELPAWAGERLGGGVVALIWFVVLNRGNANLRKKTLDAKSEP